MVFFKFILQRLYITMTQLVLCITSFRCASNQNFGWLLVLVKIVFTLQSSKVGRIWL